MPDEQAAPRRWTCTREQLTDAIGGLRVMVSLTGPAANLVVADYLADAILPQLPEAEPASLNSAEPVTVSREDLHTLLAFAVGPSGFSSNAPVHSALSRLAAAAGCPACRWIVAARTGSLDSTLALLADPLGQRIARGILRRAAMDEKDPDDPETMHLLAAVSRHSPVGLVAEECSEGDCDHDGRCPSTHACRACSLQAGSWAGEWEGQYMDECTIPAPCAPLLALAAHYGVKPLVPAEDPEGSGT